MDAVVPARPIRQVCAWCLRTIRAGDLVDGRVSHGICETCATYMGAAIESPDQREERRREAALEATFDFLARA